MKIKLAFLSALASIGVHLYLALHFYGLHYGLTAGEAACNLSTTFNCDAVAASPFAQMAGVPMAVWGLAANLVLAVLLFGWMIRWADNVVRLGAVALLTSSFIALVSVVMGTVSTFALSSYCIYCIGAYVLSFVQFELIRRSQDPGRKPLLDYIAEVFREARGYLVIIIAIPIAAYFANFIFVRKHGGEHAQRAISDSMARWKSNPSVSFDVAQPTMSLGSADAKFVITEFADFRCGHCRQASPTLKAFVQSRPDVRLDFFSYPLDGTCNDHMQGGDGLSCYLAKATYCSEKVNGKGWIMHDGIFSFQNQINSAHTMSFSKEVVEQIAAQNSIDGEALNQCIADTETDKFIREQANAGASGRITGTPAIFVNGRLLPRGQVIPVLEAAYSSGY